MIPKENIMKIAIQSGRSTYEIGFAETYRMYAEAGFESIDWISTTICPERR